jgi:phosphotransferase system HPr-like phosphotransfer protein
MPGRPRCSSRPLQAHRPRSPSGVLNAKSILAVLALDVGGGELVVLRADGDAADEALAAVEKAILDPFAARG